MKLAKSLQHAVRVFGVVAGTIAMVVALTLPTVMAGSSSSSDVALFGRHRCHSGARHCGRRYRSSCHAGGCSTGSCYTGACSTGGCYTGGCTIGGCN